MLDILKQNKFAALGIIVVLVAAAWYGISSSSSDTSALTAEVVADSKADQAVVDELLKLRAIRLEGAIFADPAFMSLQDSGVDIVSEPIGRRNPFAPLDGVKTDVSSGQSGTSRTAASSTPRSESRSQPSIPRPASE